METDNVVAVGFVIHELLGLGGGLILCYFGYRLFMARRKAHLRVHGTWNVTRRFVKNAAPGMFFALLGAIAIWITASNALAPKTFSTKNALDNSMLAAKDAHTSAPPENDNRAANEAPPVFVGVNNAVVDQSPVPPPSPIPTPDAGIQGDGNALANNSHLPEAEPMEPAPKTVEGERKSGGRKSLEKERRAAERKRSRLEEMYQSHLISSDDYKKGEEQYKSEIERYRSAMNAVKRVAE